MRRQVFLCYPRSHTALAREVEQRLSSARVDVFRDEPSIPAATSWRGAVWSAIDECDGAIVLVAPEGLRPFQAREVERLLQRHHRHEIGVVPVLLPGATGTGHPADSALAELLELQAAPLDDNLPTVVREVVARRGRPLLPRDRLEEQRRSLERATETLLRWPRTLPNGQRLTLGCEATIDAWLATDTTERVSWLLGPPGCGKSALLAETGAKQQAAGQCVIAIKADVVQQSVHDLRSLSDSLGLTDDVVDVVAALGRRRPTLLLIDQLDALADLVDLYTRRLDALLALIRETSVLPGVRVLASCRQFDFEHDVRLSSLKPVHHTQVSLLEWSNVQDLLRSAGRSPDRWSDTLRNVLRTPQHLALYLRVAEPGVMPYDSYHSILDALWAKQVHRHPEGKDRKTVLYAMASQMSSEEVLWVPAARYDGEWSAAIDGLVSDGVLQRSAHHASVGFAHQTVFDYVRSRMFVATNESLATYVLERQNGLAVRPVLWNALAYLRRADPPVYVREVATLLNQPTLRRHVRDLLEEFLGNLPNPDDAEAAWLFGLQPVPGMLLARTAGSAGWFERIKVHALLPVMKGSPDQCSLAVETLARAQHFAPVDSTALLRTFWMGTVEKRPFALWVLEQAGVWGDDQIAIAAEALSSVALDHWLVGYTVGSVCRTDPVRAVPVVRALLSICLTAARDAMTTKPQTEYSWGHERNSVASASMADTPIPALDTATEIHPTLYAELLFDWLVKLAETTAGEGDWWSPYRMDGVAEFLYDTTRPGGGGLVGLAVAAMKRLARADRPAFLRLLNEHGATEHQSVLVVISRGLVELGDPEVALDFIRGDTRRLALVDHNYHLDDSAELVALIAERGTDDQVDEIVRIVQGWAWKQPDPTNPAELRRYIRSRCRARRVHLLQRVPEPRRTKPLTAHLREEERALGPEAVPTDRLPRGGIVNPVLTAEQMAKATNAHILRLFDDDAVGRRVARREPFRAAQIDVSHTELSRFAAANPLRAIHILDNQSGTENARVAAGLVEGLGRAEVELPAVFEALRREDQRGRCTDAVVMAIAHAVGQVAKQGVRAPVWTLDRMLEWFWQAPPVIRSSHAQKVDDQPAPLLFGGTWTSRFMDSLSIVADGVFHFARVSIDRDTIDRWLTVLRERATEGDDAGEWHTILMINAALVPCGTPPHIEAFVDALIEVRPEVVASREGVHLLFHAMKGSDSAVARRWLEWLDACGWSRGPQAYGECLAVRHLVRPDEWTTAATTRILEPTRGDEGKRVSGRQVGVAHVVTEAWEDWPDRCLPLFEALVRLGGSEVLRVIADLFRRTKSVRLNEPTRRVFDLLLTNEALLDEALRHYLTPHLQELLTQDPRLVATVALAAASALLRHSGASMQSRYWRAGKDLLGIATTLQRLPGFGEQGMELLESLHAAGVHGVADLLRDADRRLDRASLERGAHEA